jgi:lipopolysaccharide biosynthesis regulator YciM
MAKHLQEVLAKHQERYAQLLEKTQQEHRLLQELAQKLEQDKAFDAEDAEAIHEAQKHHDEQMKELQNTIKHRLDTMEAKVATVLSMYETTQRRRGELDALEETEGLLRRHPRLLQFFATKQARLEVLLEQVVEKALVELNELDDQLTL